MARFRPHTTLTLGLILVGLSACGPKIRLSDSVDNEFDLRFTTPYDDRLNAPYVAGSQFRIYAYDTTEYNDLAGWTIVSRDPEVLEVDTVEVVRDDLDPDDKDDAETDVIEALVMATGPGVATLDVLDDQGNFVRATEVEVMQPDRMVLHAAGPMFIDDAGVIETEVEGEQLILANGLATFYVEWFAGEQKLSGAGALDLASPHPAAHEMWSRQSYLDEDRDWASIEFEVPAEGEELAEVEFYANGLLVETRSFEIVQPNSISEVELVGERTGGADDGDLLTVLALALDESGASIWGVAFDWDLDGIGEDGEGDLFRYWFERGASSVLGAEYDGHRGETLIEGNEGYVASSNNIGCFCSASPEAPGRGLGFGLLGLAALGLVRPRRRRGAASR